MTHCLGLEWWGRHKREEPSGVGQHLCGRLQRRLHLPPRLRRIERESGRLRLEPLEQVAGVVAIAAVGGYATGGRVRVRKQSDLLQLGELAPHCRCRDQYPRSLDQALRADGLPRGDVFLDHTENDLLLAFCQLNLHVCRHFTPGARRSPRRRGIDLDV